MNNLPPESATSTLVRQLPEFHGEQTAVAVDPETERWSRQEQLLATAVDELQVIHRLMEQQVTGKQPKWDVERVPRPGLSGNDKKAKLTEEASDILFGLLNGMQDDLPFIKNNNPEG